MRFVSVRELRSRSAEVWRRLAQEADMEPHRMAGRWRFFRPFHRPEIEESLAGLAAGPAPTAAVETMQSRSVAAGKHRMSRTAIRSGIAAVRKGRGR